MNKNPHKDASQVEKVLLSKQKNYEDLFNSLNDAATLFEMRSNGLPGRYLEVNDTLCRWLGYSREELLKLSPLDISEKVYETVNSEVAGTFAKKGKSVIERTLIAKDGRKIPVEVNFHLITYEGKKAVLSISRDISERNAAEAALRESEEKFRTFIEQNSVGFILVNKEGKIIEWNRELERISGISRNEALGKDYWEVQHQVALKDRRTPQLRDRMKTLLRSALSDMSVMQHSFEATLCRPDGTIVYFHQSVFPVKTKSGYLLGSVIRDITEQKNAEEALRKSGQRFKTLIENAFEGITIIDRNGKLTYESPGLTRLLGYPPGEQHGTTPFDNVHPDDLDRTREAFVNCLTHPEEAIHMVLRIKHRDGSWRWIECIGKNLLDDAAINGIVINYRDITERKRAEEAQQKLEQQIQQVEKLESLGILAGGIAHDFNNLLTGIFGYIDVARLYNSSGASDKVTVNLSKALEVFNRARALTQQLLTFSKGGTPVKKALPLIPLLTSTANFVLSGSNINARFSFSNDLWPCEVDENQLGQVIDNIIINARQAMPTGGSIVVTAENIPEGQLVPAPLVLGNYVRISIRDFGIGIGKEHLPHIFDPFFTTKQEGSGLGLATAYSIIRKHEGVIDVESELGIGSTFHIYLPALPSAATESLSTGIKKHHGQGTILVMDDEEFVRDVAMELLKTMGYTVEFAKHGKEAIEKYKKAFSSPAPYVLVILDLTIPGDIGGKDTVQELLKINPSVAAIAASGYSQDPVMTDPQAFGFKDKIRKPFTKEELGEVLERVVASNK